MALHVNYPFNEQVVIGKTASVGTSPVAAYACVPVKGLLVRTGAALEGTITGTAAIAVAINGGSNIGALSIAAGAAGTGATDTPSASEANRWVDEGDFISFTPSGATGTSIPASFYAVIRT